MIGRDFHAVAQRIAIGSTYYLRHQNGDQIFFRIHPELGVGNATPRVLTLGRDHLRQFWVSYDPETEPEGLTRIKVGGRVFICPLVTNFGRKSSHRHVLDCFGAENTDTIKAATLPKHFAEDPIVLSGRKQTSGPRK